MLESGEQKDIWATSIKSPFSRFSKDSNFSAFIKAIAEVNTTNFDRDMTYAFFMNVYNALAIKMIIDHPCSRQVEFS